MALPLEVAQATLDRITASPHFRTIFAQAHARYVLFQVGEDRENFPNFAEDLDDAVTELAYSLLAVGCSFAEAGERARSLRPMEQAASLLQYVHEPPANRGPGSEFHVLVAAMAYYAGSQYSRAFVIVAGVESLTDAGRLVAAFLRRNFRDLIHVVNQILLSPNYRDGDLREAPEDGHEGLDAPGVVVTALLARALNHVIEFTLSGSRQHTEEAEGLIADSMTIATSSSHAGWWWIARLLRLMLRDLGEASPWTLLPPLLPNGDKLTRYMQALAGHRHPVIELWISQRAALPRALDLNSKGAVISLRTSGGKTRVAELAMLQTLTTQEGAKVLYVAPFRSLALEVERTLAESFERLGFTVSHLYGGSQVSALDKAMAEENDIVIATPEKARAYLRAVPDMVPRFKLYVIDEGHLIGLNEREVRNELFLHHLRVLANRHKARVLLLSAVLPNADDIAAWIAGDRAAVGSSDWRPATERFGKLYWDGQQVRLEWLGETQSFNRSFVVPKKVKYEGRRKPYPATKNEAIAATALRMSSAGPVLVFTGLPAQVPTLAAAHLVGLGETPPEHPWPHDAWEQFKLVSEEHYAAEGTEIVAARAGIICHHGQLPPEVRLATENLMRSSPPKIVVATTTLAQGVNIGVSSMIVANAYVQKEPIPVSTFWNLAGRAGRAFVDTEGRVLISIDLEGDKKKVRWREKVAARYLDRRNMEPVRSGILQLLEILLRIARTTGVEFARLLELCAENNFSALADRDFLEGACDLVDDGALALHLDLGPQDRWTSDAEWVDTAFAESLAVLQAEGEHTGMGESVRKFLKARIHAGVRRVGTRQVAQGVVSSSLPLSAAMHVQGRLAEVDAAVTEYLRSPTAEALDSLIAFFEGLALELPETAIDYRPSTALLDRVRSGWMEGVPLRELLGECADDKEAKVFPQFYGFELPWVIHGAGCQLRAAGYDLSSAALESIGLLTELGLPNDVAARVYRAGVRSRTAVTELSRLLRPEEVPTLQRELRDYLCSEGLRLTVEQRGSTPLKAWVALLQRRFARRDDARLGAQSIRWNPGTAVDKLCVREHEGTLYLCSLDYEVQLPLTQENVIRAVRPAVNDPTVVYVRKAGPEADWAPVVRA